MATFPVVDLSTPASDAVRAEIRAAATRVITQRPAVPGRPEEGPYPASVGEVADELVAFITELEHAGVAQGLARETVARLLASTPAATSATTLARACEYALLAGTEEDRGCQLVTALLAAGWSPPDPVL